MDFARRIQVVEVGEELADEKRVMRAEAAAQSLAQGGQCPAECAAGEIREDLGIGGAGDERVQHGAARGAEQAAGDAGFRSCVRHVPAPSRPAAPLRWNVSRRDRSRYRVALGIPIRRNHRKCDAIAARNDLCSAYLTPKSRHVSSTSLESAG